MKMCFKCFFLYCCCRCCCYLVRDDDVLCSGVKDDNEYMLVTHTIYRYICIYIYIVWLCLVNCRQCSRCCVCRLCVAPYVKIKRKKIRFICTLRNVRSLIKSSQQMRHTLAFDLSFGHTFAKYRSVATL